MKLYKRKDFIKLPKGTIYSHNAGYADCVCQGLYRKETEAGDFENDWMEQDMISYEYKERELCIERDNGGTIRHEFDSGCRDGSFNDSDTFVVWDRSDILNLINELKLSIYDTTTNRRAVL